MKKTQHSPELGKRIGKQMFHHEKVSTTEAEFSKGGRSKADFRFLLEVNFEQSETRDKIMAVILKNPSSADEYFADQTTFNVEKYIFENFPHVAKILLLNLWSYRATKVSQLKPHLPKNQKNNKVIKESISKADSVFLAYGGPSGIDTETYENRIEEVHHFIRKNLKENGTIYQMISPWEHPLHGQMWNLNPKNEEVELI